MIRYKKSVYEEGEAHEYDLVKLYNECNEKYFDNIFPRGIPGNQEDSNRRLKEAQIGINRDYVYIGTVKASNSILAWAQAGTYGNKMTCVSIMFKRGWEWQDDMKGLTEVMLHEMCHFKTYVNHANSYDTWDPSKNGHGPEFIRDVHKIRELSGINVNERYFDGSTYIAPAIRNKRAKSNEKFNAILNDPKKSKTPLYIFAEFFLKNQKDNLGEVEDHLRSFKVFENFKPIEKGIEQKAIGRTKFGTKYIDPLVETNRIVGSTTLQYSTDEADRIYIDGYTNLGNWGISKIFKVYPEDIANWVSNKAEFAFNKNLDDHSFIYARNQEISDFILQNAEDITDQVLAKYTKWK